MSLGEKLNFLRTSKELTMEQLANLFNDKYDMSVGKSMISRWEANKSVPLNTYLTAYAKYFNVTLDYLLDLNIEDPNNPEIPYKFTNPQEAVIFLAENNVSMYSEGFDISKLSDQEKLDYANDVIEMMRLVSLKYKGKNE